MSVLFQIGAAALVLLSLAPAAAQAQDGYPTKPIRFIAPFPPGCC